MSAPCDHKWKIVSADLDSRIEWCRKCKAKRKWRKPKSVTPLPEDKMMRGPRTGEVQV